jgi:hypothetical protein
MFSRNWLITCYVSKLKGIKMYKKTLKVLFVLVLVFQFNLHSIAGNKVYNGDVPTIRDNINYFKRENPIFLITDLDYTTQYIIDVHNGHDVKTEKDLAHRKGLQAWRDDGYISFQVKRQNKIHEILVKIRKR